jgi:hypothetical protein
MIPGVLLTRSSSLAFCRCWSIKCHRYRRQAWHHASTIRDSVSWSGSASYSCARRLDCGGEKNQHRFAASELPFPALREGTLRGHLTRNRRVEGGNRAGDCTRCRLSPVLNIPSVNPSKGRQEWPRYEQARLIGANLSRQRIALHSRKQHAQAGTERQAPVRLARSSAIGRFIGQRSPIALRALTRK